MVSSALCLCVCLLDVTSAPYSSHIYWGCFVIDAGPNADGKLVSCFKHSLMNECDNDCVPNSWGETIYFICESLQAEVANVSAYFLGPSWKGISLLKVTCRFLPLVISAREENVATFRGSEYFCYDLSQNPIQSSSDEITLSFKTWQRNGLLLHTGKSADYVNLALKDGAVSLVINLGSGAFEAIVEPVNGKFNDNAWHDIKVTRNLRQVIGRSSDGRSLESGGFFFFRFRLAASKSFETELALRMSPCSDWLSFHRHSSETSPRQMSLYFWLSLRLHEFFLI